MRDHGKRPETRRLTAATVVTLARAALLPLLWWWAALGMTRWVGLGFAVACLGDALDGWLARRMSQVTRLGGVLDSAVDGLALLSAFVWLFWLVPEISDPPRLPLVLVGLTTWLGVVSVGLIKFRRFLNLHLYTGKASGVFGVLFVVDALVLGFSPTLFYMAVGALLLGNLESLTVMLTRPRVDEHIGSILKRRGPAVGAGRG